MTENSEESMPLTLHFSNIRENNIIETIHRIGPYGSITLRVINSYGFNEVFQLFLTNSETCRYSKILEFSSEF